MNDATSSGQTLAEFSVGLWKDVWASKRLFGIVLVAALVVSVALAMTLPPRYRAKASILPPMDQEGLGGMLSSVGSLAGMINLGGGGTSADLYPVVASSRTIIEGLLRRSYGAGDLQSVLLKGQKPDSTNLYLLKAMLQEKISATKNLKTGMVTISYSNEDPYLAAAIVNGVVEEMEGYFDSQLASETHNQKILLENRLHSIADSLQVQESRLEGFLLANRDFNQAPNLALRESRLRRDLEISNGIYLELIRQYELVKIQDTAQGPILKVLDRAEVPMIHYWPEKRKIVLMGVFLSLVLTLAWVKISQALRQV